MNIIALIRFLLTLLVSYAFLYEYLGKKYYRIYNELKLKNESSKTLQETFNLTDIHLSKDHFSFDDQ
jgi:hypothetical protein